jgi:hypothetical protein
MDDNRTEAWGILRKAALDVLRRGTKYAERREKPYLQQITMGLDMRWFAESFELLVTDDMSYVVSTFWLQETIDPQVEEIQIALKSEEKLNDIMPNLQTRLVPIPYSFASSSVERFRSVILSTREMRDYGRVGLQSEVAIRGANWNIQCSTGGLWIPVEWPQYEKLLSSVKKQLVDLGYL